MVVLYVFDLLKIINSKQEYFVQESNHTGVLYVSDFLNRTSLYSHSLTNQTTMVVQYVFDLLKRVNL